VYSCASTYDFKHFITFIIIVRLKCARVCIVLRAKRKASKSYSAKRVLFKLYARERKGD
jgi:hypothetical protein